MANIYLGNTQLGKGGITPVNTLPTANQENYNKHELYLNDGELKYIDYSNSTYEYKTLASSDVVNTISFTISTTTYQAEDGMTWNDWCSSEYNTGEWVANAGDVYFVGGVYYYYVQLNGTNVKPTDAIINGTTYTIYTVNAGGGGDN